MSTNLLSVSLDQEGFLTDPQEWSPEVAEVLAAEEEIVLGPRHWIVINYVRQEYDRSGESPTLRNISKRSGVVTKELYALFPKGPAKKVARIAGLSKPKGCI